MLTPAKKTKLTAALKNYKKKYLDINLKELDESGTRLMINHFLCDVLDYKPIEEVKTEYMIKGTYADYVIQLGGVRHFLVEVKALSLDLSEKHLRRTINYGANEGIEWAMLTNGKTFEFYKILFNKPIDARLVFSVDLSDINGLKQAAEFLQYLHKDAVTKKSLKLLWNKCEALHHLNIAGILLSQSSVDFLKKIIRTKYNEKCADDEILKSLYRICNEKINPELIKPFKLNHRNASKPKPSKPAEAVQITQEKTVDVFNEVTPVMN